MAKDSSSQLLSAHLEKSGEETPAALTRRSDSQTDGR